MLFIDIKNYFVEKEVENYEDEDYINDLENSKDIDQLITVVADYHNMDDLESASFILNKVVK